jgi:hypothetical protein
MYGGSEEDWVASLKEAAAKAAAKAAKRKLERVAEED